MAARFHFIGDRTDRLFSNGERCMRRWQFEDAVQAFDAASQTDPSYAHLHLYKGIALAEMDRYKEAVSQIEKGRELAPANPFFPMSAGCLHLDEGNVLAANAAFERAAGLAPTNRVIAGYRILAEFIAGNASALTRVQPFVDLTPWSFQARLLMAMPASQSTTGAQMPAPPGKLTGNIEKWFFDRKVRRLLARNEHEAFVEFVESAPVVWQTEWKPRLGDARKQALRTLREEIDRVGTKSGADTQRRELYIRSANLRGTDSSGQASDLTRWLESYRASKNKRDDQTAAAVCVALADLKSKDGQLQAALDLCAQSRAIAPSAETDWIEAHVQSKSGKTRLARRLFERFAAAEPLTFRERVLERLHSHA